MRSESGSAGALIGKYISVSALRMAATAVLVREKSGPSLPCHLAGGLPPPAFRRRRSFLVGTVVETGFYRDQRDRGRDHSTSHAR